MRLARLISIMVMVLSLAGNTFGQGKSGSTAGSTTGTLSLDDFFDSLQKNVALENFYVEAEQRTDIVQAAQEVAAALADMGIRLKPLADKNTIHYSKDVPVGPCRAQCHWASDDGAWALDIVQFTDKAAAVKFRGALPGRTNWGSTSPAQKIIINVNGPDQKAELTAIVYAGPIFVYLNKTLPFSATYESLKRADQDLLRTLKDETDAFNAAAELTFKYLVVPADRAWMPRPGDESMAAAKRISDFTYLWSEVKYNFANFDLVPQVNWDRMRNRYLPLVQNARTHEEYQRVLQKFMAELHDGHTSVFGSSYPRPDIVVCPIEGKAIITAVGNNVGTEGAKLKPGMEITHVDGRAVKDVLEHDLYPYISASTPQSRDCAAYAWMLAGPNTPTDTVRIHVRDLDGSVTLKRLSNGEGRTSDRRPRPFEYRGLPGNIAYVALNTFGSRDVDIEFDKIFAEKILKADGLIIDVRKNQGGSTDIGDAITARLIDKPLQSSNSKTRQYLPSMRAWGRDSYSWHDLGMDEVKPRGDKPFLGPVVVLTSAETFSAGEDFLIPLKYGKRATLVGERTGGSTGQPLMVEIGGSFGIRARICTKRDTYPDGTEFVGVGVIPDIEVHPTIRDIAEQRDRVLDEGIATLKKMIASK